jgi:cysteinyl-tRNA synthetase
MSKSLKNFITIDEILRRFTPRQLRLAFLAQLWNAGMDFSEALMAGEVRSVETQFNVRVCVCKQEPALTGGRAELLRNCQGAREPGEGRGPEAFRSARVRRA